MSYSENRIVPVPGAIYDSVELAQFEAVLASVLTEVSRATGCAQTEESCLAAAAAAAIFDCAAFGERDHERLRRYALTVVSPPAANVDTPPG